MPKGRCLCRAIEFETNVEPVFVSHCHCESCRRQTGSIVATFVGFKSEQVTITKGSVTEHNSSPDVYRGFCGNCGSALYYRQSTWGETHLYIGAYNEPSHFQARNHVFYDEHIAGYELHDNLARFGPSGHQPLRWGPLPTENVLFLCTGNSARSILAEAITNRIARGGIRAFSAGSQPIGTIKPGATKELAKRDYRTAHLRSKSWDDFVDGPGFHWVITLCDSVANEACPAFAGSYETQHWGMPDPASGATSFAQTYAGLEQRIEALLADW